jgi:hypothetical protein
VNGGEAGRRGRVLVAIAALLVAGGVADRSARPAPIAPGGGDDGTPVAAPAGAISSTWYCAGATASPDGPADGTVIIANPGPREVTGSVTVVPDQGAPRAVPLTVPGFSRALLRHQDVVQAGYAAALVELDGGEVAVEHGVSGRLGEGVTPCARTASDRWYFAEGSTARDDTLLLALYNPFPEDAIADLSFSTDQGRAAPGDYQGMVVRGGRLGVVNVGDHVRRRNAVAVTVQARSGRLVVDRIQLRQGARKGMSLALGAPSPAPRWYFPEGMTGDGITERFHLYNPSGREAEVDLEVALEDGVAEPFRVSVPPHDRVTVVANDDGRIPKGVPHAVTVVAANDVAVVAERSIDAVAPAARQGAADSVGARRTARRWVVAGGASTEALDEWVVVQNVGATPVAVSVSLLASGQALPVEGLQDVTVPAGQRRGFRLGDTVRRDDLSLVVSATAPVVVERTLYRLGGIGISTAIAIPLR